MTGIPGHMSPRARGGLSHEPLLLLPPSNAPSSERGGTAEGSAVNSAGQRENFNSMSALTQQGGCGTSRGIARTDPGQKPVLAASMWE